MLDFSWSELMVVIVVAVIAIGPKQLPEVLYGLGRIVRRMQYMRYALTRQFDDFMDESDLRQFRETPLQGKPLQMEATAATPAPRLIDPADMDEAEADEGLVVKPYIVDEADAKKDGQD